MANKMIHNYTAANTIDASADFLLIDPASSGIYKSINRNTLLGLASAPLGTTDSQSPTNKTFDNTNTFTIKDGSLTIQNSAGTTKQAVFSAAGITAGQTRTFTFPDASGTLATIAATQTLTNKTLTSPVITGGTIDNSTITVDSIAGHTSATVVTVANLQISNGVLNTNNSVVAANITAGAVQPQALVAGTGSSWAFTTWAPTWTNFTVGNGTVNTAKYIQNGKAVHGRLKVTLGSTSAVSGDVSFTLPVTAASDAADNGNLLTQSFFNQPGVGSVPGFALFASTTSVKLRVPTATGTYVGTASLSSTVPFTWATGNTIEVDFTYEAA